MHYLWFAFVCIDNGYSIHSQQMPHQQEMDTVCSCQTLSWIAEEVMNEQVIEDEDGQLFFLYFFFF